MIAEAAKAWELSVDLQIAHWLHEIVYAMWTLVVLAAVRVIFWRDS